MKRAVLAIVIAIAFVGVSMGTSFAQAPKTIPLVNAKSKAMGTVTFNHETHSKENKCDVCHATAAPTTASHALKTAGATPNAFHVAMAKSGLCVDCHKTAAAAGKTVPTKCADCHKKA